MTSSAPNRASTSSLPPAVVPSPVCSATVNPIRQVVDNISIPFAPPSKPLIPLSIGDPTVFGNLPVPSHLKTCMVNAICSNLHDGYAPCHGSQKVREAIAHRYSYPNSTFYPHIDKVEGAALTPSDVFVCSGCSGAIDIAISAVAEAGSNILIPRPGFPLYLTICGRYSIEPRCYHLIAEHQWEADLSHLRSLIDSRTRAILVNNPSNPNGSVFSLTHIQAILKIAEEFNLPIISDEVYADMVFNNAAFYPMGAVPSSVVVLTVGGIAKQFVCPGWRLGWVLLYGKGRNVAALRAGLQALTQVIIGANTVVQGALVEFLPTVTPEYYYDLMGKIESHSKCICEAINEIPGLKAIEPSGALYLMVGVDPAAFVGISNDEEFAQQLLNEEFVFVLPGKIFGCPNFFRIVICAPISIMEQAARRIKDFCARRSKVDGKGAATLTVVNAGKAMVNGNGNDHK